MKKYFYFKGFTLVELILVISILAILSTIAFISFQNYTKSARDSVRLASIKNVMGGLEISHIKIGKYPQPDHGQTLYGNTGSYIIQGEIGNNVKNLIGLQNDFKDPLDGTPYVYGVFKDGEYYQIATNREETPTSYISTTYASNLGVMLDGNYQFDPSLPSLITITGSVNTNSGIFDGNVCFIINNGENNFSSNSTNCKKKSEMNLKNYDKDLAGYWDMETLTTDGKLKDLSGNGNDGSFSGGMSYTTALTGGVVGRGLNFNGMSNVINCGTGKNLELENELTISAVVNAHSGGLMPILTKQGTGKGYDLNSGCSGYANYCGYLVGMGKLNVDDSKMLFGRVFDSFGTTSRTVDRETWPKNMIEYENTPIMISYRVKDNDIGYIFINGHLYGQSTSIVQKISKSKNPLFIGRYWNDMIAGVGYDFFNGNIDDIKIYNRALLDEEILQQAKIAGF